MTNHTEVELPIPNGYLPGHSDDYNRGREDGIKAAIEYLSGKDIKVLQHVAAIAHTGGRENLTPAEALNRIRFLTLRWFEREHEKSKEKLKAALDASALPARPYRGGPWSNPDPTGAKPAPPPNPPIRSRS